jgi:hypothetical protein
MSGYTAIADIGETLIDLLRNSMKDLIPPDSIVLFSPGEIETNDSLRLSLFLYQVAENIHMKNQEMQIIDSTRLKYPSMGLDLYYMLTSYPSSGISDKTERMKEEHSVLGRAMQVLNDNAILTGSVLKGSLARDGDELHVMLAPTSLDDMTKIWTVFPGKSFRTSVCYLVTPVMIDSAREIGVQRVKSKETNYNKIIPGVEN